MIAQLFNQPHVVHQTPGENDPVPNEAIAAHVDNCGTILLQQIDSVIVIDRGTVPDLCRVLRKLAKNTGESAGGNS